MQPRLLSEPLRLASRPLLRLQTDERLVAMVRAGSHPAFAEVVHRYRPALVRYTGRLVGDDRAEDVVQQGLASAHTALMSDERPIDLKPWLYRIVHNAALNVLRGERDVLALDAHEGDRVAPGVEAQVEERERFRSVISAVQSLPTAQRDALLLRELEGRSHEEIATALGVTAGAARQHLMRARATMRAAVTVVTPYPLALKLAALGAGAGAGAAGLPAAEVVTGAGVGFSLSKLGASVLAAGALAGGAGVVVPAIVPEQRAERAQGTERPAGPPASGARVSSTAPAVGDAAPGALSAVDAGHRARDGAARPGRREDDSRERGDRSGRKAGGHGERRGPGTTSPNRGEDGRREGSSTGDAAEDDRRDRLSSSGRGSSGSDSSGPGSGSSGSGSSGSGSSGSGDSGASAGDSGGSGSGTSGSGSGDVPSGSSGDSHSNGSGSLTDAEDGDDHSGSHDASP